MKKCARDFQAKLDRKAEKELDRKAATWLCRAALAPQKKIVSGKLICLELVSSRAGGSFGPGGGQDYSPNPTVVPTT